MDTRTLKTEIAKEALGVLRSTLLFILYYIMLIFIGVGCFGFAIWLTFQIPYWFMEMQSINIRLILVGVMLFLGMWCFCFRIAWYLVKPLFQVHHAEVDRYKEVTANDCPELFEMISVLAKQTGNKMPKHVYLTLEQNASVFYDSVSIWSLFFPTKKNLVLGIGLLQGMNKDEIKSIIGHEFGHFSQNTMKVGSVTFRLFKIIDGMIEIAKDEQKSAFLNSEGGEISLFHLASLPITLITRKTIEFYNYIEKRNRKLSRLMELEADAVTCQIVGARPFISSLCKSQKLSQCFDLFAQEVFKSLERGQYVSDFHNSYRAASLASMQDRNISFSFDTMFDAPINGRPIPASKLDFENVWSTHPSFSCRLEQASLYLDDTLSLIREDATEFVPLSIQDEVFVLWQQHIYANQFAPKLWDELSCVGGEEFCSAMQSYFDTNMHREFIMPFILKFPDCFDIPSEPEIPADVPNPFNDNNWYFLTEVEMATSDLQQLENLYAEGISNIAYDGVSNISLLDAINMHRSYLENLNEKFEVHNRLVFDYLCQFSGDYSAVSRIYWQMFYPQVVIERHSELFQMVKSIDEYEQFLTENGREMPSLTDDCRNELYDKLLLLTKELDYEILEKYCGHLYLDDALCISQLLREWQNFASEEYIDPENLKPGTLTPAQVASIIKTGECPVHFGSMPPQNCIVPTQEPLLIKSFDAYTLYSKAKQLFQAINMICQNGVAEWRKLVVTCVYPPNEK